MSLEKLDKIINEMEEIGADFKRYREIYQELTELQDKIANSVENLKENKDSLESLNKDITSSVDRLRKKVEELNSLLPQKMLEIMTSNKDIQIDIKTKHEEIIKILNNRIKELSSNIDKSNTTIIESLKLLSNRTERQSKLLLILSIIITIFIVLDLMPYIIQLSNH